MALTPQNNDAFFREVDENLRQDQMIAAARRFGPLIGALVVVALIALAGFLWWRAHQAQQAALASETLNPALASLESGGVAANQPALTKLAAGPRPAYSAAARFALADSMIAKGDMVAATTTFDAIAGDSAVPQAQRDFATIRAVQLQFDTLSPDKVIDRLKTLAIPGNPYFPSAGEMTALSLLKLGKKDKAGALLVAIVKDPNTPSPMRGRMAGLATNLGQTVAAPPLASTPGL